MEELFRIYRLGQVAVYPDAEAALLVLHDGEDDDGDIHGRRVVLEHSGHVKAIDLRHHHVEDNEVGLADAHHVKGRLAVCRLGDVVACVGELLPQQGPDGRIVVYHQDSRGLLEVSVGGMLDLLLQAVQDTLELDGLLAGLPDQGHREIEGAAHPGLALHPDDAPVVLDDLAADGQAQAGALRFVGQGVARLAEAFEDLVLVGLGYADARILHLYNELVLFLVGFDGNRAFGRKLHRIGEQIDHHLDELVFVSAHQGKVFGHFLLQLQLLLLKQGRSGRNGPADDVLQKDGPHVPFHTPRFDLGQVEHVVDQAGQALPFGDYHIEVLAYLYHGALDFLVVYGHGREHLVF